MNDQAINKACRYAGGRVESNFHMDDQKLKSFGAIECMIRSGFGPNVFFLHGIGSNAESFASVFQSLPKNLNLFAWNAPGYVGSSPLLKSWPADEDYARALNELFEHLNLEQVHLVGHSLGSLIATSFASLFPEKLKSIVLVSTANGYGSKTCKSLPDTILNRLNDLSQLGPEGFAKSRAKNLIHNPTQNSEVVANVEAEMSRINPSGYKQALLMLARGNLPENIKKVSLEPSFIIGRYDTVTPLSQTQMAAEAWRAAHGKLPNITQIDHAGHAVYLQNPKDFNSALLTHIAKATATSFNGV